MRKLEMKILDIVSLHKMWLLSFELHSRSQPEQKRTKKIFMRRVRFLILLSSFSVNVMESYFIYLVN